MSYLKVFVIFVVGMLVFGGLYNRCTDHHVTVTVQGKEYQSGQYGRYLIFTDGTTYKNSDTFWYWKFDSSDIYGRIEEGETYKMHVYGWRIPFLSSYPNIISMEKYNNTGE